MNKSKIFGLITLLVATLFVSNSVSAETKDGWSTIVSKMQNSTTIQELKNRGNDVTFTSDASKMTIEMSGPTITTPYVITYNHTSDIVSYTSANTANDIEYAIFEGMIHREFLYNVALYYGYDANAFSKWLEEVDNTKLAVGIDGIEFTKYTLKGEKTTENGTATISISTYKTLKVNIECGVSAFHNNTTPEEQPKEEVVTPEVQEPVDEVVTPEVQQPEPEKVKPNVEQTVNNPDTGLYISLGVTVLALITIGTLIFTKKKNYFSKI